MFERFTEWNVSYFLKLFERFTEMECQMDHLSPMVNAEAKGDFTDSSVKPQQPLVAQLTSVQSENQQPLP